MANILNIGQTGLNAAQLGLATTGHNIANAATPGYSRQLVIQSTPLAQNVGVAFVGNGTSVTEIKRAYNDFLANQVTTAQTSQSQLGTYYTQMQQINNMFADPTSGLSPTLQKFFSTIQNVAANPTSGASRQTMLASANTLASQFQGMDAQLSDIRQGVNAQITTTLGSINAYATQIASLNDAISKAQLGSNLKPANDLLDQRDQVLSELSKQVQVSVVKQGDNFNVFIGNGQPLVVSNQASTLVAVASPTDLSRMEVGYRQGSNAVIPLAESSITGGALGGLFDFRAKSLDPAQNALGRMAIGMATTFNAQHQLGQDQNGSLGGAFFNVGTPVVTPNTLNTGSAVVSASITSVSALTTSDYELKITTAAIPPAPAVATTPGVYKLTRLSDGTSSTFSSFPQTVDGVAFNIASGSIATGDDFLIKPTIAGAASLSVAINDTAKIAVAAPIRTAATLANAGSAQISAGAVNSSYTASTVTPAVTLTYNSATNKLSGFPAAMAVTVTNNGTSTVFAAGTPVTYADGATISFGGVSFTVSGAPANGDTYTIGPNSNGTGDNRNALLLGALQSANTLVNGTASYQGAYALLVNTTGNKTRELEVTSSAADKLVTNAVASQQAVSGVNLDEEATNLMKYQQAYQAAGKVMQTASKMFDVLLSLGS